MAEDAVDTAVRVRGLPAGPSPTASLPLVGAAPPHVLAGLPAPRRLVRLYGTEAPAVHALAARDARLGEPVLPGYPVTGAELLWSLRHEGALDEEDVLDRRTRLGLVPADRATALGVVRELVNGALSPGG
jgi:glycerol-3-phosphate dehydrogenase